MSDDWRDFELEEEVAKQRASGRPYREFLRVPAFSLYVNATSEHSFFEIDEDITLLVFFASGGPAGDER